MAKPPVVKPVVCPYCGETFVPGQPILTDAGQLDFSNPANSGLLVLLEDF
jgi:hypothetical protein